MKTSKINIQNDIRSGFYSADDIISRMSDIDVNAAETQIYIWEQFEANDSTVQTSRDVVALQELFDELSSEGYIALHKAGYTSSDAYDLIDEVFAKTSFKPYGYLLYNEQDLSRSYNDGELTLSFGAFRDTEQTQSSGKDKQETGSYFKSRLEGKGFKVSWDGDIQKKISILDFDFRKKYDGDRWGYERCVSLLNALRTLGY